MANAEARALGACDTVKVKGQEYRPSPISMKELQEIQRQAVRSFKREYLTSYAENLDLLPETIRQEKLDAKMDEVSKWDIGDLPVKMAYDVTRIKWTKKLDELLVQEYGDMPETDAGKRAVLATALDAGTVSLDQIQRLTGTKPRRGRIPYDSWWITAKFEGIIMMAWVSLRPEHPELTKDEVAGWPIPKLAETARLAERLTAPALKNT